MFQKVVILSDSTSAIQAITSIKPPINSKILEIKKLSRLLKNQHKIVVLQWIPAHCGLQGNETADQLAKKGTKIIQKPTQKLSYHSAKLIINKNFKFEQTKWQIMNNSNKSWAVLLDNKQVVPDSPRAAAVASFRLLTGHDCLAAHLHKIGILDSPKCILCQEEESIMDGHHLFHCSALKSSPTRTLTTLY